ncbi:MAG: type II toxin-antitoxin system RelE/ParE family toxin [Oscillatoriales cyanobacterium]|nr:MAG: type II toxin-antitoxin system RelE/ParE family toxin [Oscillatoriales cyanobacterium]
MTSSNPIEIRFTPEFQRKLKFLFKKYRQIRSDLEPILEKIRLSESIGDQIPGIEAKVIKVRIKNSDNQKGKSGGYRLIYWISAPEVIVLLDIYSKSEQSNISSEEIRQIINDFLNHETTGDD